MLLLPVPQVGFTSTLIAPATPMLKLRDVIRSTTTASMYADLVYNNSKTNYQLSLKVFLLNAMLLLKLNCMKMPPRRSAQMAGLLLN